MKEQLLVKIVICIAHMHIYIVYIYIYRHNAMCSLCTRQKKQLTPVISIKLDCYSLLHIIWSWTNDDDIQIQPANTYNHFHFGKRQLHHRPCQQIRMVPSPVPNFQHQILTVILSFIPLLSLPSSPSFPLKQYLLNKSQLNSPRITSFTLLIQYKCKIKSKWYS